MTDHRDEPPRLSVMFVGERSLATQRRGRYIAGSAAHPARMAPDLAAALIEDYTRPGDLVLDPLAGTGTTLVEAVHADRNAVGMEIEPGWAALARRNLTHARAYGAAGHGRVIRGDATRLPASIPVELRGQVTLILTAPPPARVMPVQRARRSRVAFIDGMTAVLTGCVPLLAPEGVIVVVTRPWRRNCHLRDPARSVAAAADAAGLELIDSRRAVHATVRGNRFVARHTFCGRGVAEAREPRRPTVSALCHDDIAVLSPAPTTGFSSRETRA